MPRLPDAQPVRSYSQLSQLEACGEQYRLQRIVRAPSEPAVWFPAGTAFHTATEMFDLAAYKNGLQQAIVLHDWGAVFTECLGWAIANEIESKAYNPDTGTWRSAGKPTKQWPNGEDVSWWQEHGPDMVRAYIAWRVKTADRYELWTDLCGTPGIEYEGTADLGAVPVIVKVDRVFVDRGTGATIIVDLKTGRHTPASLLQLRVYRMVLERVAAVPMWYGAYYEARKGELTTPQALDTYAEAAILERFKRAEWSIQTGVFNPRPSPDNCRQCSFRKHCLFAE